MADYKNKLSSLSEQFKTAPVAAPPIQKVVPVKESKTENDTPLNVRIDKDLLKRIKLYGLQNDLTLKEITTQALEAYLNK